MVEITIGTIRRTRFLTPIVFINPPDDESSKRHPESHPWDVKDEFKDVVNSFMRNKILIEFTTSDVDTTSYGRDSEYQILSDSIHEYCDENCTGYWSMTQSYYRGSSWNHSTGVSSYDDTGKGKMNIFFEKEEDIPGFLKDCAILIKLAN